MAIQLFFYSMTFHLIHFRWTIWHYNYNFLGKIRKMRRFCNFNLITSLLYNYWYKVLIRCGVFLEVPHRHNGCLQKKLLDTWYLFTRGTTGLTFEVIIIQALNSLDIYTCIITTKKWSILRGFRLTAGICL
jgi:hypothetical protein